MNPMAIVLALMSTAGTLGALGRGRPRRVETEEDNAVAGTDSTTVEERVPAGSTPPVDSGRPATGQEVPVQNDQPRIDPNPTPPREDTTPTPPRGDTAPTPPRGDTTPTPPREDTTPPRPPEEPVAQKPVSIPKPPVQTGGEASDGGDVAPTELSGDPVAAYSGRMMTLAPEGDDITSVRIVSQPQHGHVSVNPDNTLALVLTQTEATGPMSFTYEVTHTDGTTSLHKTPLDVTAGPQLKGWGTSEKHYMLEVDENDRVVVEHGENHRKVYISKSDAALTRADIAALEGVTVDKVTGSFLAARPHYGASEETALAPDAGMQLWGRVSGKGSETSNWLLFERGYSYGAEVSHPVRLVQEAASGESELNPLYIGAWGEGAKPTMTEKQMVFQDVSRNIVMQDLHFADGLKIFEAENVVLDNLTVSDQELAVLGGSEGSWGITIRNTDFRDVWREEPVSSNTGDTWSGTPNRISGLYVSGTEGLLLEKNFFDHNGFAPDYRADGSLEGGQPPSMFSHNVYLQFNLDDVTVRDSIFMRGASFGIQVRSGGFIEDNVFIDNNIGLNALGGVDKKGLPSDNYSLIVDNVVTAAAYRTAPQIGALNWGISTDGFLNSLVDNIVAHSADPNNPAEIAAKGGNFGGKSNIRGNNLYEDTIHYNWGANDGVEGLDPAILNQTTIQLFTAQLLGKPNATIQDLAKVLRAQADGQLDDVVDADLIVRFFQSGFGIAPDVRMEAGLLRFIPDELGEGVRWDNRMNWSTKDLPGFAGLDSVDLGGNEVIFGGNVKIDELEFGPNGGLHVLHGKLTVSGGLETGAEAAALDVGKAGQVWTEGGRGTGELDIDVTGGRFANTGNFRMDSDLTASGGQTLLGVDGARYAVTNGSRLEIEGDAKVGFDGEANGQSILGLGREGTLAFTAKDGKLGTIEEFRSGAFGDDPAVLSGADLGGGRLEIDLTELVDGAGTFTLLDVDELIGGFKSTNVTGLGARNAELVIDYGTDAVSLILSAGSGKTSVKTVGNEGMFDAGEAALWNALTAGRGTYDEAAPATDDDDYLFAA